MSKPRTHIFAAGLSCGSFYIKDSGKIPGIFSNRLNYTRSYGTVWFGLLEPKEETMRIVIFDLNRTLYDPITKTLVPGAKSVLSSLRAEGVSLYLISRREKGRDDILLKHGIAKFFRTITFVDDKNTRI